MFKKMFNLRWPTLIIIIFAITVISIELFAVFKLYHRLKNEAQINRKFKLKFDRYIKEFNKSYNDGEYKRRLENFKASLKEIARLNKLENNTVFGLTKFSDMSKEEFVDRMLLKSYGTKPCNNITLSCTDSPYESKIQDNDTIPQSFDWRQRGVVKPVLNQRMCQGCWAFSIIGVLESMSAIQLGDLNSRSIQELLDCSSNTNGCYFGSVVIAMRYACSKKMEFVTEQEYPMTLAMEKNCKLPKDGYSGRRIKQYVHTCKMNETLMAKYIAHHGPLVVAVDSSNWMNYIGGVITRACTRGISNHVVQIVGYAGYGGQDPETPIPYYIVRNSFGEDFGDHGYVKVAMKHGDIEDVCGIAEQVTAMDALKDKE